jgi:hypothetical protein
MDYIKAFGVTASGRPSYVNGNPAAGIQGSIPDVAVWEYPMREILAVIEAAGITPSNSDLTQLLEALRLLTKPVGATGVQSFTTAGSATFTAAVTGLHRITGFGAGGGGGGSIATTGAGGGGGGGGRGVRYIFLTAGLSSALVVPAGGVGGTSVVTPTSGGTASFVGVALASGGSPGQNVGAGQAGLGGNAGNGLVTGGVNTLGGGGSQGYNVTAYYGGNGGQCPGAGFGAYQSIQNGNPGALGGTGSGGGGGVNGTGGAGADGGILIEW